ncbi:hypothetical protein AAVH_40306, partial [Aphelenchoides avenae]
GQFIALKTESSEVRPTRRRCEKLTNWWLTSRLSRIPEVIVGVKKDVPHAVKPSTVITSVKSLTPDSILDELSGTAVGATWRPQEQCVAYTHYFLSELKKFVDSKPEGTIFSCRFGGDQEKDVRVRVEPESKDTYVYLKEMLETRLSKFDEASRML